MIRYQGVDGLPAVQSCKSAKAVVMSGNVGRYV